jgi:hypothetical protein
MIIVTANVGLFPLKSGKKREPISVRSKRPKHFRREGHATIWIADAHRAGKRFIVRVGEKLTAFVKLKRAI